MPKTDGAAGQATPSAQTAAAGEGMQQAGAPVTPESAGKNGTGVAEKTVTAVQEQNQSQAAADMQARADKEKQQQAEKVRQEKARAESDDPIGRMIADKNAVAAGTGKQMIQVAALGSQQKASELQARLSQAGIRSHTQKVKTQNGEERIRVRIGPLSGKREVDKTCARLKSMGLSCTLVSN